MLSGHNDVYGEVFRELEKLDVGDEVIVYSGSEAFRYIVRREQIVVPTDVSALRQTPGPRGHASHLLSLLGGYAPGGDHCRTQALKN